MVGGSYVFSAFRLFGISSPSIRRKIRFQLVCSVLRASPAALRGHNGVLDSVGICRGRRSSSKFSLRAYLPWPDLPVTHTGFWDPPPFRLLY